jgi:snurportin-1
LPQEFVQQMGPKLLRAGRLLRFSIRSGGLLFNTDGSPAGADLAYEGPANQRRGRADIYSKVLFQWQARRQPVQLNALLLAAATAGQLEQGETQQQNNSMADD